MKHNLLKNAHFQFGSILNGILVFILMILLATNGWAFSTISLSPTRNAVDVSVLTNIEVQFDETVDGATITNDTFNVDGSQSGRHTCSFSGSGTYTITCDPDKDFKPGETISITLTTGIQTTGGTPLYKPKTWQFIVDGGYGLGVFSNGQQVIATNADCASSVYAADIDGDGDLDVVSASGCDDTVAWYQHTGDSWIYRQISLLESVDSVCAADIDGDGDIDVLSASGVSDRVGLHLNNGSGYSWTYQNISSTAYNVQSISVADMDGDGDLDVLAACKYGMIEWYENGNAWAVTSIPTEVWGSYEVYAVDMDNDGDLDMLTSSIVSDNGLSRISWYENGNSWTSNLIAAAWYDVRRVYPADIDGDGDIDVLAAEHSDDHILCYENFGGGSWGLRYVTSTANLVTSLFPADMDGDGDIDVLAALYSDDQILWYRSAGDGTWWGTGNNVTSLTNGPTSVFAADIDGDGDVDVLSASWNDDKIAWYENENDFIYASASPSQNAVGVPADTDIIVLFAGIINGATITNDTFNVDGSQSGRHTCIFSGSGKNKITCNPDVDFKPGETITVTLTTGIQSTDGTNLYNPETWQFVIEGGNGGGIFVDQNVISTNADGADFVCAADMDGDGDLDVLSASHDDDKIAWYENGNEWAETIVTASADYALCVAAADMDGDGDMDVLAASVNDNTIAWYENGNEWAKTTVTTFAGGATSVSAADMDADGDLDILSASCFNDTIAWYENGNSWVKTTISTNADSAVSVYAADIDNDGDLDVLSASHDDNKIAWYENGNAWAETVITTNAVCAHSVYAADLDGDGDMDVLSASSCDNKIAWYENGNAWTETVISTSAAGAISVIAVDLDGDSYLDVLSASALDNKIAWYENGSWAETIITTSANGATSVCAADIDGDGDLDVLSASVDDDKIAWYENRTDTDNDGIFDSDETYIYNTDPNDLDSDDDGIDDGDELTFWGTDWNTNFDSDTITNNLLDPDTDNDGINDGDEINTYSTIPNDPDSDDDSIGDGDELSYWGADWNNNFDSDGITNNLLDDDSDNDTCLDGTEVENNSDPSDPTTLPVYYLDSDGDGYGDAGNSTTACEQPAGYVLNSTDCNDGNDTIYPGAAEICDGQINDCNTATLTSNEIDDDDDGYVECTIDIGGWDGATSKLGDDCDDTDINEFPGQTWYHDADGDGFGDNADSTTACEQPLNYVLDSTDCDDDDADEHPGQTWYSDIDADGYGDLEDSTVSCEQPDGYVLDDTDNCPEDPNKIVPGNCGCGNTEASCVPASSGDDGGGGGGGGCFIDSMSSNQ